VQLRVLTRLGIVLTVALLWGAFFVTPAASAAFPSRNGKIAYARGSTDPDSGDVYSDIWSMNPDGSVKTNLTPDTFQSVEDQPAWSPDGATIAAYRRATGSFGTGTGIFRMDQDGGAPAQILDASDDDQPVWSPDGSRIAFRSVGTSTDIAVMNADGTARVNLTSDTAIDRNPSWSPDGSKIAFERNSEIYVITPDGTGLTNLTNNSAVDGDPDWSPDGSKIAFSSTRGNSDIYVMNADGSGQTNVTHNTTTLLHTQPAWSPDGTKIAFTRGNGGTFRILVMNADGTDQTVLTPETPNAIRNVSPAWQPLAAADFSRYPRPGSATPLQVPLVTSYEACTAPNSQHVTPLSIPACNPPIQESTIATSSSIGKGWGITLFQAQLGNPGTAADEADIRIVGIATDVSYCRETTPTGKCGGGPINDYDAKLLLRATIRITDRLSGAGDLPGTVSDASLDVPLNCTRTANQTLGSRCEVDTTADTLIPNYVREGKSTIISAVEVTVNDEGLDLQGYGDSCPPQCGSGDETTYLRQGLFLP
jgi:Tol biopolymer transport system component